MHVACKGSCCETTRCEQNLPNIGRSEFSTEFSCGPHPVLKPVVIPLCTGRREGAIPVSEPVTDSATAIPQLEEHLHRIQNVLTRLLHHDGSTAVVLSKSARARPYDRPLLPISFLAEAVEVAEDAVVAQVEPVAVPVCGEFIHERLQYPTSFA